MKSGSPMSNSASSVGRACSWAAPVVALFSLFEGEARPSLSSGSKESTWGSSVIKPSFLLPGPLGPNVHRSVPYAHALCYLFRPRDWVLAPGVDNLRVGFWLTARGPPRQP